MVEGIIFDMDGVLFDSEHIHHKAWYQIFDKYGIKTDIEEMKRFTGFSANIIPKYFRDKTGINIPDSSVNDQQEILNILIKDEIKAMPYVKEFIFRVKEKKLPIALASSSRHKLINICLEATDMKKFFNVICSGEDVENGKPAPDIFLYAAEKLNVLPSKCLVLEDSVSGVKGAKAAGSYAWAYTSSFNKEILIEAGADMVFDSFRELLNVDCFKIK